MTIDSIQNGYVIDHIPAGRAMALYTHLGLERLGTPVAMILHAVSARMGRKDIIKIDGDMELSLDVVGYLAPGATVNVIRDGMLQEKKTLELPETLTGVIRCRNPRCITSAERDLPAVFRLADREKQVYRCVYCEAKYEG
jgi:aspartate carbamoyltransferase regulatory subunit